MKLDDINKQKILKTRKGSVIKRSKFGVGKMIGRNLYLHRKYIKRLPSEIKHKVLQAEEFIAGFPYNIVRIGFDDGRISFVNSTDFDEVPEPTVGEYITVNPETNEVKRGRSNSIWHHKWLWVDDDYTGFDVDDSFERSKKYIKKDIDFSRVGNKNFWEKNYAKKL